MSKTNDKLPRECSRTANSTPSLAAKFFDGSNVRVHARHLQPTAASSTSTPQAIALAGEDHD
jgi:hypothetical protein